MLGGLNAKTSPPLVLHRACKNNGSFSLGLRLDKLETFQEDKYEWQLQRSSNACQIESQQIFQND